MLFRSTKQKIEEPTYWRDRRFARPEQPIVGVSWDDAMRFCAWISIASELQTAGVTATLPTEAQWEFAARGKDRRKYPWGNEKPDATRAVFARREGPARVGSCSAGRGPFGHLDLIGNVCQWCRDGVSTESYEARVGKKPLDPLTPCADEDRALRGSGWGEAQARAAAFRHDLWAWSRVDYGGFRVAAEPMRTGERTKSNV